MSNSTILIEKAISSLGKGRKRPIRIGNKYLENWGWELGIRELGVFRNVKCLHEIIAIANAIVGVRCCQDLGELVGLHMSLAVHSWSS